MLSGIIDLELHMSLKSVNAVSMVVPTMMKSIATSGVFSMPNGTAKFGSGNSSYAIQPATSRIFS